MTDSHRHPRKPTPKQLRYLKDLTLRTGQTFTYPSTAAQASREIDRLKGTSPTSLEDRRRELRQVSHDLAERRGDAARVATEIEVDGWGSSAHWR